MIALQDKLLALKTAFVSVHTATYHYQRPARAAVPFAVWKEDHEDLSIEANNVKAEQGIVGYLDYFTASNLTRRSMLSRHVSTRRPQSSTGIWIRSIRKMRPG